MLQVSQWEIVAQLWPNKSTSQLNCDHNDPPAVWVDCVAVGWVSNALWDVADILKLDLTKWYDTKIHKGSTDYKT